MRDIEGILEGEVDRLTEENSALSAKLYQAQNALLHANVKALRHIEAAVKRIEVLEATVAQYKDRSAWEPEMRAARQPLSTATAALWHTAEDGKEDD